MREKYYNDKIDAKAYVVQLIFKLPCILLIGLVGAIIGSGLYLLITLSQNRVQYYQKELAYYIDFAPAKLNGLDHYNAYTWNTVLGQDEILGEMMQVLGSDYDRNVVKDMLKAYMLSDVRYLTVIITGTDAEEIEEIGACLSDALVRFGQKKAEFERIYQVYNNPTEAVKVDYFTWRAALLGFIVVSVLAVLGYSVLFGLGDRIYTMKEVKRTLGINALGIWYKSGNQTNGVYQLQLYNVLKHLAQEASCDLNSNDIVCVDVDDSYSSENFINEYKATNPGHNLIHAPYPRKCQEDYDRIRASAGAVVIIPFGAKIRVSAEDVINELQLQNCNILGAVLINVDKKWMNIYTGRKG